MKYLLKQNKEDKGILCDKVIIEGFEYYTSGEIENTSGKIAYIDNTTYKNELRIVTTTFGKDNLKDCKKVIACNNPNIEIPLVVSKNYVLEGLALKETKDIDNSQFDRGVIYGFFKGYNKSQEMFSFTKEDMIEFAEWCQNQYFYSTVEKKWSTEFKIYDGVLYTTKELLKIWKEQQPKIIYYNE